MDGKFTFQFINLTTNEYIILLILKNNNKNIWDVRYNHALSVRKQIKIIDYILKVIRFKIIFKNKLI